MNGLLSNSWWGSPLGCTGRLARLVQNFTKFSFVGLIGAALQIGLLWLVIKQLHMPVLAATPLVLEVILLHNFAWHENFTWRNRRFNNMQQRLAALGRFHVSNGSVSLVGNTAIMYLLIHALQMPVMSSAVVAIAICGVLNFLLADRWVYTKTPPVNTPRA